MSALDTQVGGMNQDEIIAMAREAGFRTGHIDLTTGEPIPFIAPASGTSCMWEVLRFAALVAAKEREACAQVCEAIRTNPPKGEPDDVERGFNAAIRRSAYAIRARSQQ